MSEDTPPEDEATQDDGTLSLAARIMRLRQRHRELDAEIEAIYDYPYRDQLKLQRLKKRKLRIRDDIQRLEDELIPDLNA